MARAPCAELAKVRGRPDLPGLIRFSGKRATVIERSMLGFIVCETEQHMSEKMDGARRCDEVGTLREPWEPFDAHDAEPDWRNNVAKHRRDEVSLLIVSV